MATTRLPWVVEVKDHPGSSAQEIADEPDWGAGHSHRIGFMNRDSRVPGLTHKRDDYDKEIEHARRELRQLHDDAREGRLINFRDLIEKQDVSLSVLLHLNVSQ
jgi:nitrate reductase (NAD(P)H)